jgi:hypothetical protein
LPAAVRAKEAALAASNPMYPEHYLKVLGFFEETDRDWYETVHAADFMSFAAPFMARYARNWIVAVEAGETPAFRVITEIEYRNARAKDRVRSLMGSPAGGPLLAHSLAHRAARGAAAAVPPAPEPPRLFSVEPHVVAGGGARARRAEPAERRVLLLRRSGGADRAAFAAATIALCRDIARSQPGTGVSLDLVGANPQPGPGDAVVYLSNAGSAVLPDLARRALQVLAVLRVETRSSVG